MEKLAGNLQHAALVIPGGWGLFSPIQMAMQGSPKFVTVTPMLREALRDWRTIIKQVSKIPTHVLQIVDGLPDYLGYCDACKLGAGGVLFGTTEDIGYWVWRVKFPDDIIQRLCTNDNPDGDVTMNDLELVGLILEWLALEMVAPSLIFKHVGFNCDNTSAVSWIQKFRTSKSRIAARLLRILSLRIHRRRASPLLTTNIAGEHNGMADVASRSFRDGHAFNLKYKNLTNYFNSLFPLPTQCGSWQELIIPDELVSRVMSCVRYEPQALASLLRLPGLDKNTLPSGAHCFKNLVATTPSSNLRPNWKTSSLSQPLLHRSGQVATAKEIASKFSPFRKRSVPSPRPSNWLENLPPSTKKARKNTYSPSHTS